MSNDDRRNAEDSREDLKKTNERRIEELLNINNRYVRTKRHLKQNSNIATLDQLEHAFEIQKTEKREWRILKI